MIKVVYEDDWLVVLDKPSNMLVHHSHYARNITSNSLIEEYQLLFNKKIYPVHRLDYKTNGLILCVKSKESVFTFQKTLESGRKSYLALVRGWTSGGKIINTPVKPRDVKTHLSALSVCHTMANFEMPFSIGKFEKSRYSLIRLSPITGRTNQLRIHMAKINHPIIGDSRYGDRYHNHYFKEEGLSEHLLLTADQLVIFHPFLKRRIFIRSNEKTISMVLTKFAGIIQKG